MSACASSRMDVYRIARPSSVNDGWLSYPGRLVRFTGGSLMATSAPARKRTRKTSVPGRAFCASATLAATSDRASGCAMFRFMFSPRRRSSRSLLHVDQHGSLLDCRAGRDAHVFHSTVRGCAQFVLHLHGLHDDETLAGPHLVTQIGRA